MSDVHLTGTEPTAARYSFEVFPARSAQAALALGHAVGHLAAVRPDFISVTYGASGSNRDTTGDLLRHLRANTQTLPMAHLTSVASQSSALKSQVHAFMDDGIHDFLALRGDIPKGLSDFHPDVTESPSSVELIRIITQARHERPAFSSIGRTAVAAYPNGHPRSISRRADIDWLVAKQEAGASLAITQLFFHADEYLEFVDQACSAGVTIPILPGIMPVSTSAQLRKVAELAGQQAPRHLEQSMDAAGGFAPEIGIEYAFSLCRELLDGGAPSLHLYTFNRHEFVLELLVELELVSSDVLRN